VQAGQAIPQTMRAVIDDFVGTVMERDLSVMERDLLTWVAQGRFQTEMDKLVDQRTNELRCMNEKLMADQEIARGMQLAMLPASLPGNDYVAFSSFYIPAENLSGDFYNVFKIDEFRFGIYIGDVSGHGISAAMLSIFIFQKMQSLMEEKGGEGMTIPSVVLKHLYDSLNSANFNENMYVVMLYGVFDSQTGIFSYASGGLNTLPLRIRPDGSIQELDNDGFAICKLGELIKPKFINHQILLFPGDKLLIYTDGLIDARSRDDSLPYSVERLKNAIEHNYKWGLKQLLESIKQDVQSYSTDKSPDDITLMAVDVLPPF
jgi:sigma-B regulation protein RsbU (phosphoserine phosphatase)